MSGGVFRVASILLDLVQIGVLVALLMALRPRREPYRPVPARGQYSPEDAPTIPLVSRPADPPPQGPRRR